MKKTRVLAFDYGASSGRAMLGTYDGKTIELKEIHRFNNDPVMVHNTLHWDLLRLFYEMKQGMMKANLDGGFESIGVDTWGVDFGLLDREGNLLENPVHYRDDRTKGMFEKAFLYLDKEEFYQITGNQFMEINTVFQLLYLVQNRKELMERADIMLLMPDLLNYMLTGEKKTEYSIASTTQMLDAVKGSWSEQVVKALSIPRNLLTDIIPTGTKVGKLTESLCKELMLESCDVIAVAGHDTQCAMAAVPAMQEDYIFISCGTWSLLGTELNAPLINKKTAAFNLTNEGGYGKKASFLKNITGLWLIQESRRQWVREGKEYSFSELEEMARDAEPFTCFIDPDAPEFGTAGNIPERIREFCRKTGQRVPQTVGQIVRCIDESLAMKYRMVMNEIAECTGKEYSAVHMVGGGIKSKLLCQMTADACGCEVIAGPVEATVLGNVSLQLIALGEIKDLTEARQIISNLEEIKKYQPEEHDVYDKSYAEFVRIQVI